MNLTHPIFMRRFTLPALLLAGLLTQCHQADPGPVSPEDQLPPATQTGAHTFGLLLNGEAWKPNGAIGSLSNYRVVYDPGYAGGNLNIRVFRFTTQKVEQYFFISGTTIDKPGTYAIRNGGPCGVYYKSGLPSPCYEYYYATAPGLVVRGQLTISRLDKAQGIIAGTFDFNLWQPGCDTVKVTKGRFDYTL